MPSRSLGLKSGQIPLAVLVAAVACRFREDGLGAGC